MTESYHHLDPRIQRTRAYLREAFIDLVLDRGYQDITVTNLAERALINRSTFYLHYHDIEDLMTSGFGEYWERVLPGSPLFVYHKPVLDADRLLAILESDLAHFDDLRQFYRVMLCEEQICPFENCLSDHLLKITQERFAPPYTYADLPAIPLPLVHTWAASAYLGVVRSWLEKEEPESISTLAPRLADLFLSTFQTSPARTRPREFNQLQEESGFAGIVS